MEGEEEQDNKANGRMNDRVKTEEENVSSGK